MICPPNKFPWLRPVAAGCFIIAASNLIAQQRYQNWEEEFSWFRMRLTEIALGLEAEWQSETSKLSDEATPFKRDYIYLAPTVTLGMRGSVYHPNLLQFDLKTENGVGWQAQSLNVPAGIAPAGPESKTTFLERYHGELAFLREKPYAFFVNADKDHNFRQYDFFNRSTVDNERYGARAGYAAGPVPFSVSFNHLEEDVSNFSRPRRLTGGYWRKARVDWDGCPVT